MDDEEPVDPKPQIEEDCRQNCTSALSEYESCTERIKKDTTGQAHCTGQYLDFWKCIDKCTVPKVFAGLK